MSEIFIHPTATVEEGALLGKGTRIYNYSQIRSGAILGEQCIVGSHTNIGPGVVIGNRCKIQAHSEFGLGVTLEDGVFIGAGVIFANDILPRAISPDGSLKGVDDWILSPVLVKYGASIGNGVSILAGVTIGRWALVGMGAVVIRGVPDYGLVVGNPARLIGFVCKCGRRFRSLHKFGEGYTEVPLTCSCGLRTVIPADIYSLLWRRPRD